MDISIVVVLIVLALQEVLCNSYTNSTFDIDLPSAELIIFTTGGPVPDYLLNSPYKIVPLPNRSFTRRADDPRTTVEFSKKESQNSTFVKDYATNPSLRYKPQTTNRQLGKQRKQKNRNRPGDQNLERYNQRIEPTAAVPNRLQPNSQVTSTKRDRKVAVPSQSKGPAYIIDANKLKTAPSNRYRDRNVVKTDKLNLGDYNNEASKLTTAPSNLYRDRKEIDSSGSTRPVYTNDINKKPTVPSFLLPSGNFPAPAAFPPLSPVYSTNPSFAVSKLPTPYKKLNRFPKPVVKGYETAAYGLGPLYKPYSFGYDVFDGYGTKQYRQESATGDGVIRGNYGYKDFQGIYRQVEYTADENGFHAVLKSNEPGLANVDTADVSVSVEPPPVWPPSEK